MKEPIWVKYFADAFPLAARATILGTYNVYQFQTFRASLLYGVLPILEQIETTALGTDQAFYFTTNLSYLICDSFI